MAKKSMFLTYVLWLVGGFFGLHHIYLERDSQAFLWWCTLGGYVGCGWLRDIFHIPEYVADANEDKKFMEKYIQRLRTHETVIFVELPCAHYKYTAFQDVSI
jgi:DnaJ family protein C protein 22